MLQQYLLLYDETTCCNNGVYKIRMVCIGNNKTFSTIVKLLCYDMLFYVMLIYTLQHKSCTSNFIVLVYI